MSTEVAGSTARRQLGRRLRELREGAGLSPEAAAKAVGVSRQTIWRIEDARVATKKATVEILCHRYNAAPAIAEALAALAVATTERDWWEEPFGAAVPKWFRQCVELEAEACRVSAWGCSLIPGILQTGDYARAVIEAAVQTAGGSVDRQVQLRLARGERLLSRAPQVQVTVVLGEGALRCQVGGPGVMAEQADHLRRLSAEGLAEIRVLPFAVGAHPAMVGPFMILGVDGDPDVVYLETEIDGRCVERKEQIDYYRQIFDTIHKHSVPIGEHR